MLISVNQRGDGNLRVNTYSGSRPDPDDQIYRDTPLAGNATDARLKAYIDIFINNSNTSVQDLVNILQTTIQELQTRGDKILSRKP